MKYDFLELVKRALPPDVELQELLKLSPPAWWEKKTYLAAAHALRKCARINWEAYLHNNDDVRATGLDACLHFLKHGIYEGRKLFSWHRLKTAENAHTPVVSVIIANYNNAPYLDNCIQSVVDQTLRNIEIVIVDDASHDSSIKIIEKYMKADSRIKLFVNAHNMGIVYTRKRGVNAAHGRYIMFLDSDDYLKSHACACAVNAISKGYDMVKFAGKAFSNYDIPTTCLTEAESYMNMGNECEYYADEISTAMYKERKIGWTIWLNIILREICVKAFSELEEGNFVMAEDVYSMLAITRHVRSMYKISDKLVCYNYGSGICFTKDKVRILNNIQNMANILCAIKRYASTYSLNINQRQLYLYLCYDIIVRLINSVPTADAPYFFRKIADTVGIENIISSQIYYKPKSLSQLSKLVPVPDGTRSIKHIGIFYPRLSPGGLERVIQSLCALMVSRQYKLTIFTETKSNYDLAFPAGVEICYIHPYSSDGKTQILRLKNLAREALRAKIDVMIHAATYLPCIFWDLLLLHYYNIPVIFAHHSSFTISYIGREQISEADRNETFKHAAAVTCLSRVDELYLRMFNINAFYVPNPVKQFPYIQRAQVPQKIALMGRLGDPLKQIGHGLRVLKEVISRAPWISMILIGDFYSYEQEQEYLATVREYGLQENITLTGWTQNPHYFLRQCGVLLSVSANESFGLSIMEAQALGIPGVVYDLPIEPAIDNPAIISVPQGDYVVAAREIVQLLTDNQKWQELSRVAVAKSKRYAPEYFLMRTEGLLDNFQNQMPIEYYTPEDYKTIVKYISYYSKWRSTFPEKWNS